MRIWHPILGVPCPVPFPGPIIQFRNQKGQETKQSYRQYSRREVKTSKCPICCPKCQKPPLSREPLSGRTFSKQEPCIITDSRLIGHRGLFSHEVKSINIVRLLTDQSKKTDGGRRENLSKICTTKNTVPSSCYPSPDPGPSTYCGPFLSPYKKNRKKTFIVGEKKCDTNVSFLNLTESFERNRKPFLKYTLSAPRNGSSHLKFWEECSIDTEKSYLNKLFKNSSPPHHCPLLHQYMQSYYPSHTLPSTSKFYRLDMSQYPPSDRLEKGLSPRKLSFPFYPSPEHWSYPRMKLY
uniref:Uncharacterized protein n=1 Tax=Paramormyrops kingsleyae TaxID=1676925 RepID=A0A3B3QC29_9TELE